MKNRFRFSYSIAVMNNFGFVPIIFDEFNMTSMINRNKWKLREDFMQNLIQ